MLLVLAVDRTVLEQRDLKLHHSSACVEIMPQK